MKERKLGLILSYFLIIVDVIVGLIFTPTVIHLLGNQEYGLYRVIASIASYLAVLDFGIGSTITRYVVKYNTENNREAAENFCALGLLIYGFLSFVILTISIVISYFLPNLFPSSINDHNLIESKIILMLLTSNTILTLISHAFSGLLNAYKKFVFLNIVNICKLIARAGIVIAVLTIWKSAIVIAAVELSVTLTALVISILYKNKKIDLRIRLHKWDIPLVKEIFIFTSAIFIQAIITQFNGNLDNLLIGAMVSASAVAVYTIGLQLFTIFGGLSTAVLNIFTPSIMEDVFKNDDNDAIVESLILPSRMQLIILSLVYTGYIFWGKSFIILWVDKSYSEAFYVGLILFSTSFIDLIQNNFYSVLKAKNVLHQRTGILIGATILNFALTIFLLPKYGIVGAAIGTGFSYIVGNAIALNVFYKCYLKLNIWKFFSGVFKKMPIPLLLSVGVGILISKYVPSNSWINLIISIGIYTIAYSLLIATLGLSKEELGNLKRIVRKEK